MSEENIDNNRNKHSLPVTVIVKRIVKRTKLKNLRNGSQVSLGKYPDKMGVWGSI